MKITLRLYAILQEYYCEKMPKGIITIHLPAGSKVSNIVEILKIPKDVIKLVVVNEKKSNIDHPLTDGDYVMLFPAMAGG